jgi:hypothetical protein
MYGALILEPTCEAAEALHYIHGCINPLNAELNPICHLLELLGAHHILHVSRVRVNSTNHKLAYTVYSKCSSFIC